MIDEHRNEAREAALGAAEKLWDSWGGEDDDYDGAVVTGYVLITEAVLPSGYLSVAWAGGNGQPPGSEGLTGLASHRIIGLLEHVAAEVRADMATSE